MSLSTDSSEPADALLTEDEQALWQSLIFIVISLPVVLDRELRDNEGITHFEFSVLARLSQADGARLRLSDLAKQTGSTLPRLSKAITRCEREGWAERLPADADGRSKLAALTDAGRRQLLASAPAHLTQVRRLVLDPLTADARCQLRASLSRIAEAVQQDL